MRILLVSDEESPYLWDYYQPGRLEGIDLILSCGDLKPEYLSFLVTMSTAPLFYVHGNHDGRYDRNPPEGCECIENRVVTFRGIRILGLGGSIRYSSGEHQFTEEEMERRIRKLRSQLRRTKGVDLVITHSPVRGIGDMETFSHKGFEAFLPFARQYKPKIWAFGHVHKSYSHDDKRIFRTEVTAFVNACERLVIDYDEETGKVSFPFQKENRSCIEIRLPEK